MKLLLRAYDDKGEVIERATRFFEVTQAGDGVYNVPTDDGERSASVVTVSVIEP